MKLLISLGISVSMLALWYANIGLKPAKAQQSENTTVEAEVTNDHDGDGMPTPWENLYGLDPTDPSDADQDLDVDGLTNLQEFRYLTDPTNPDTDGGSLGDGDEISQGKDPLDPRDDVEDIIDFDDERHSPRSTDKRGDSDGDGLSNKTEKIYGTNPHDKDTDNDGIDDYSELFIYFTDPLEPDTDDDDLLDGEEVFQFYSDPNLVDTDFDLLTDSTEVRIYGTSPILWDTDGGQVPDGDEILNNGTDPLNPDDDIKIDINYFLGDIPLDEFEGSDKNKIQTVEGIDVTLDITKPDHVEAITVTYLGVTRGSKDIDSTYTLFSTEPGLNELRIEAIVSSDQTVTITKFVEVLPRGKIFARMGGTFRNLFRGLDFVDEGPLANGSVIVHRYDDKLDIWKNYVIENPDSVNPQIVAENGTYAFILEPGIYRISFSKPGLQTRQIFVDADGYKIVSKNVYSKYNYDLLAWGVLFVALFHLIYGGYLLFVRTKYYKPFSTFVHRH